jgi:nucleotide-binding universal stress UspA family protein
MARTIVTGYDNEEPAQRALERAIEEAKGGGGQIVIVAVMEMPLDPEGPQNYGTLDDSPARMIPLVAPPELDAILARARERIETEGIPSDYVWAAGDPAEVIVQVARDRNADLVVLGAHHHGLLTRLFNLDVASEVEHQLGSETVVVE